MKAYRQLLVQASVSLLCAVFVLLFADWRGAYSALLGGIAVIIPSFLFIVCAFYYSGARAANKIAGAFFVGEILKFFSMAILIVAILKLIPIQPLIFLLAFLSVQVLSVIIGFFWIDRKVTVEV